MQSLNHRRSGLLLGIAAAAFACGTAGGQQFHRLVGGPTDEWGYHVELDVDRGLVLTGLVREPFMQAADVYICKDLPDGKIMWNLAYGTPEANDIGYSVRPVPFMAPGGYIVACETSFIPHLGIGLIRLDQMGNPIWAFVYPGTAHQDLLLSPLPGVAVRELADGGFIVVGHRVLDPITQRGVAIRTDPMGMPIWMFEYMDPTADTSMLTFTDVRERMDMDGMQYFDISATCSTNLAAPDRDMMLVRLNAGGMPVFARKYPAFGPGNLIQETGDGLDEYQMPGSDIYLVGRTDLGAPGVPASQVLRVNGAGFPISFVRLHQIESAYAAIRLDSVGNVMFSGRAPGPAGFGTATMLCSLQPFLAPNWLMTYRWPMTTGGESVTVIPGPGPDSYAMVGGERNAGYGLDDVYLVWTDSQGVTDPRCPEGPMPIMPEMPPVAMLDVQLIPQPLFEIAAWPGPRPVVMSDTIECVPCHVTCDYNDDGGGDNTDVTDLANSIAAGTDPYPQHCKDYNQDGGADNSDVTDIANDIAAGNC